MLIVVMPSITSMRDAIMLRYGLDRPDLAWKAGHLPVSMLCFLAGFFMSFWPAKWHYRLLAYATGQNASDAVLSMHFALNAITNKDRPIHEPLDPTRREIRLLYIESVESGSGSIVSHTLTVPFSTAHRYYALSYRWGDPTETEQITVNDRPHEITKSLASAIRAILRHFAQQRDQVPFLLLWTDALCINQCDNLEKKHQIGIMADIYKNASCVISFLGNDDRIEAAFGGLMSLTKKLPWEYRCGNDFTRSVAAVWRLLLRKCLRPVTVRRLLSSVMTSKLSQIKNTGHSDERSTGSQVLRSLENLASDPYWTRTWVMQEIVFARKLLLLGGKHSLHGYEIQNFLDWKNCYTLAMIQELWRPSPTMEAQLCEALLPINKMRTAFRRIETIWLLRGRIDPLRPGPMLPAAAISVLSLQLAASDPKDEIYGLLALTDTNIQADYDIPVAEIYCRYFHHVLTTTKSLELLEDAGVGWEGNACPTELPSWCPAWNKLADIDFQATTAKLRGNLALRLLERSQALPNADAIHNVFIDGRMLSCRVSGVDTVQGKLGHHSTTASLLEALAERTRDDAQLHWLRQFAIELAPPNSGFDLPPTKDERTQSSWTCWLVILFDMLTNILQSDRPGHLAPMTSKMICETISWLGISTDEDFGASVAKKVFGIDSSIFGDWGDMSADDIFKARRSSEDDSSSPPKYNCYPELEWFDDRLLSPGCFCLMSCGLLVCGPPLVNHDDEIVVLQSFPKPMIVRQFGSGHQIVGICHVLGEYADGLLRNRKGSPVAHTRFEFL